MPGKIGRNDPCPCGSGLKYKHCCGRPKDPARTDVLYVHPAKQAVDFNFDWNRAGNAYAFIPVGVIGLANLLRDRGKVVRGLNFPLEKMLDEEFELREWLGQWRGAYLVMIDLHWYEHSYGAIDVARVCREVLPDAWTVLGGFTASAFSKEILSDFPQVDFIIRGDAERPLLDLERRLLRRGRGSARRVSGLSEIPNLAHRVGRDVAENELGFCATADQLDVLDFVDIDFLEHDMEYSVWQYQRTELTLPLDTFTLRGHWLCVGRGCRHECSFCGGCRSAHRMLAGREQPFLRSPDVVAVDINRLKEAGVEQVALSLDIAELGGEYWGRLFRNLSRQGIAIGLYDELFQLPAEEFIQEFVKTCDLEHSRLALSPLSGSEKVRRLNGKLFSNDEFFDILAVLREHEVPIFVYFSLNLPGENDGTFEATLAMAEKIYDYYPEHLLRMVNMCHTVDPCSPMSQWPEKYSIRVEMHDFRDYYDYCRSTSLSGAGAQTGLRRGFTAAAPAERSLETMAQRWNEASEGAGPSWWRVPSSW